MANACAIWRACGWSGEEREFRDLVAGVWPEPRQEYDPSTRSVVWRAIIAPTAAQQAAAARFEVLDAVYAFNLESARTAVDLAANPERPRGAECSRWDDVPPGLKTKTMARGRAQGAPQGGRPRNHQLRSWPPLALLRPILCGRDRADARVTPEVRAAAAERAYWAIVAPPDATPL